LPPNLLGIGQEMPVTHENSIPDPSWACVIKLGTLARCIELK